MDTTSSPPDPSRLVVGFAHALRSAGVAVPTDAVTTFASALGQVGITTRDRVYWAGRATLVNRPDDIERYDLVFQSFWMLDRATSPHPAAPIPISLSVDSGLDAEPLDVAEDHNPPAAVLRWSALEVLREKDFSRYGAEDWDEFHRLIRRLRMTVETRRSRRLQPDRHHGGRPDIGRTIRKAVRTDGVPIRWAHRRPTRPPRRVVLIVDVSGSMDPYARALLRFAQATVSARGVQRTEVFALGTRLTRVTRELSGRDPDAAAAMAAAAVADWAGGTRLGEGLETFNDRWGARGTARGAIVVILSDGWDRGDPAQMAGEMGRLRRVAHRVVWVNPLKASPGYAPLARGMAAALPFIDQFVEGHSLAALEHLAAVMGGDKRLVTVSAREGTGS